MEEGRVEIGQLLGALLSLEAKRVEEMLETPPDPEMGDLAFPCFVLSSREKKAPAAIAAALADKLARQRGEYWEKVTPRGPYLNFFLDAPALGRKVLQRIFREGAAYGGSAAGAGRTVVIDFSSPNIAKPFSIGHLRSTVIGHSLYLLFQALGYRCVGVNHLGDWGTQFGKIIVAFRRWGEEDALRADPVDHLFQLYVHFHREAEANPDLEEEARTWFKRLEEGDGEATLHWSRFRELSLHSYEEIYRLLGIRFDHYHGESHYNDMLEDTIRLVQEKGIARESEGALIVDLEKHGLPPCMLRKKDGATLYVTRDIAAAIYRYNTFNFDRALYVVGAEQKLHFAQLFKVLELLGFEWADRCVHVPFGLIRFKGGRMSTREGKVVLLEEVLQRAIGLARDIIEEKNPDLAGKEEAARAVGLGAVRFGDLGNDRIKDIEFDWNKVMDFTGETAPYIQYSHARICSILRKAGSFSREEAWGAAALLQEEEEKGLIKALATLPERVEAAAEGYRPSLVARHLVEVAREFNRFYHRCPVLGSAGPLQDARLLLIDATRQVLANGLGLLGISAPEEM